MEAIKKKINIYNLIHYLVLTLLILTITILISSKSNLAFNIIGYRTYTILSGIMEPTYYPGDIVIVKNKNKTTLKINDVVTFVDDKEVVTHRIVEKTNDQYITKGDNNDVNDSRPLTNDNIIVKVIFKIPKAGYIVQFLSQKSVVAVELILLGIFILIYNRD